MKREVKNVPALRFPEFEGEWIAKKLGDDIQDSGYGPRFNSDDYSDVGNVKTIRGTDISSDGEILYDQVPLALLDEQFIKRHTLMDGDLVMITTADCGLTGVFRKQTISYIPSAYAVRLQLKDTSSPIYFKYYFQTVLAQNQVSRFIRKATVANLPGSDILKFDVNFPSLSEQQKIASFLTAVDDKIQQLSKKKALLEQYKKSVMQQLFSQKLRFKDDQGNEYPDWEERTLGELCKVAKSGGTPTSTKPEYYDGDIPFLSISDMTKQGKYLNYTSNHISSLGLKNSTAWILPINTLIYSMYASVGFVSINKIALATSQAVLNIIPVDEVNIEFLYYSLVEFQDKTHKFITTGTQGNLNAQTVKGFLVGVPCYPEQTKIASFLSVIDDKINGVNQQIEHTRQFKKGLLQQMFV